MGLKSYLFEVGSKLLHGHHVQQFASITIALGIAGKLYTYFDQMIRQSQDAFNGLKNVAFSDYLIAYMSASALPEGLTIVAGAVAFAMTWRITYDLKPKAKA